MKLTVIQPGYYAGERPDAAIADFLLQEVQSAGGDLIVMPEYANAGGLSDREALLAALPRGEQMLQQAAELARQKGIYLAVNVLQQRESLRNSTYLFDKQGKVAFIYDKVHLPPAEVKLGIRSGNGNCICDLDGIRFAFMTCYDVYFYEQTEFIARHKPDVIIVPGYQRGERWDIIQAQTKMLAFRCNAFVARASYSMDSGEKGGNTMIVAPDGQILSNLGADKGSVTVELDPKWKYMRPAGFGGEPVRNDAFIDQGLRPDVF